jgi:pimeloyl-ACP methyl ester carboxylesterase
MATFVLVHGSWGGGWEWRLVDDRLSALGHDVYRPTLTGLGERRHVGHDAQVIAPDRLSTMLDEIAVMAPAAATR